MTRGIFIVGTDTDVGKTVVTAGIIYVLRKNGYNTTYFKAALSGALEIDGALIPGDTKLVNEVSGLKEAYENTTPYVFKMPVSPHLASKLEKKSIDLNVIKEKYNDLKQKYDYIVAEGSGGIICPLIDDEKGVYTIEKLINDLNMSVIIVASAGLGTINHTVLTVRYIEAAGINIKGIVFNQYEEGMLCDDNIRMISEMTKIPIIGKIPNEESIENVEVEAMRSIFEKALDVNQIMELMEVL